MGKSEYIKVTRAEEAPAEQGGRGQGSAPFLQALGGTGPRQTGASVTAAAIGMGLAAQSASDNGLLAFASTLPEGEQPLPRGEQESATRVASASADTPGQAPEQEPGLTGALQVETGTGEQKTGTVSDAAEPNFIAADPPTSDPGMTDGQPVVQISTGARAEGVAPAEPAAVPRAPSTDTQTEGSIGVGGGDAVPPVDPEPEDHGGSDGGMVDSLLDPVLGEDGLVGDLLDGLLDPVLGDNGIVDMLIGEDGVLSGVLGDGGLIDSVVGDGGLVDAVLGEEGLVGDLLGDGGLVDGVLGDDGLVGGLLGGDGLVDSILGDDGLVEGVLGDDGLVGGLLGDDGVVDAVLGDGGLVDGVLGEDGVVGGLLGDNGVVDAVLGDDGLLGGVLAEDGLVGGLLGEGGLLGGLFGGGVDEIEEVLPTDLTGTVIDEVTGVLDEATETVAPVVDAVLGDDGLVGGLLGGVTELGDAVPTDLTGTVVGEVTGVLDEATETVAPVVDAVLGEDGVVGGLLGGVTEIGDAVPSDLTGTLVGEVTGVLDEATETVAPVVDAVLGEDGVVGGLLGGVTEVGDAVPTDLTGTVVGQVTGVLDEATETVAPVVDAVLGEDGVVGGLLSGVTEIGDAVPSDLTGTLVGEVTGVLDEATETVAPVVDAVLGEDGVVGGLLGGVTEVGDAVPTDLTGTVVGQVTGVLDEATETVAPVVDGVLGEDGLVGGLVGGLLGGSRTTVPLAAPDAEVAEATGTLPDPAPTVEAVLTAEESATDINDVAAVQPEAPVDASGTNTALPDDTIGAPGVEGEPPQGPVPPEEWGDDGFLDTLVAGEADGDILGTGNSILDGLLGDADVFGVDIDPVPVEDDLFAGLSGGDLTGTLVDQGILSLSEAEADPAADSGIDDLLSDILAGGVGDIIGETGDFDAFFEGDDVEEDAGEAIESPAADLGEASAVEDALGILFDQGLDQGDALLSGLFDRAVEDSSV